MFVYVYRLVQTCLFLSVLEMMTSSVWVGPWPWPSAYGEGHGKKLEIEDKYAGLLDQKSKQLNLCLEIFQKIPKLREKKYIYAFFLPFLYW